MTIAIIGGTGKLGGHIIDALIERGTDPTDILALGRNEQRLTHLSHRGIGIARADLADVTATATALNGAQTVLLISAGDPGQRVQLHTNGIAAVQSAGAQRLVYTSALEAPTTKFVLAGDHARTEQLIAESGIPSTIMRMGWYTENHLADFESARQRGVIANSVGAGRIASATRRDLGEATAVVLATSGHEGKAYELSGDTAWSFEEFAATARQVLGTPVRYDALTGDQEREQLVAAGLDEATVGFIAMMNADIRDDVLALTNGDLARLIGRPAEPLVDTMRSWL